MSPLMTQLKTYVKILDDCFFPERCADCGFAYSDSSVLTGLCPRCASKLPIREVDQIRLFLDLYRDRDEADALRYLPVLIATWYKSPINRMIRELKFHAGKEHARLLGELLSLTLDRYLDGVKSGEIPVFAQDHVYFDSVVALPLHPRRLRERSYNQAHEIVRCMLKSQGELEDLSTAFSRPKYTQRQSEMSSREERMQNVALAFEAETQLKDRYVLLVDDVMTSGASLTSAAKAIYAVGAKEVTALVCSSGHAGLGTVNT